MADTNANIHRYDESRIHALLDAMQPRARLAFACAIAERLLPLYDHFSHVTGQGDPAGLRRALDLAWSIAASGLSRAEEVEQAQALAQSLVPDDSAGDWSEQSPLAQNAAAAVAYALRVWRSGDPQEAVWGARQLYEAADYLVQKRASTHSYVDGHDEEPMALALVAIEATLLAAASASVVDLREEAERDGLKFLRLLEGDT